jgi:hypothetical protein
MPQIFYRRVGQVQIHSVPQKQLVGEVCPGVVHHKDGKVSEIAGT